MTIAVQPIGRSGFDQIPIDDEDSSKESSASLSSSSIGKNSDNWRSDGEDSSGEKEVESAYKGSIYSLDSLEEPLPIRRGLSSCYQGKSKSFMSLPETITSCKSASDFAKPDNAYARRRRNELAKKMFFKPPNIVPRTGGRISKRNPTGRQKHSLLSPNYPSVRTSVDHSSNTSSSSSYSSSSSTMSLLKSDLEGLDASGSSTGVKNGCS